MNKQKLSSIAVIIIVYLLGLVSGSLVTKTGIRCSFRRGRKRPEHIAGKFKSRMVKRLSSKLQLNDEQKDELTSIVEKHRPEMKKMTQTMSEKMKELRNKMELDIKNILNEEQANKFDKILKKHGKFYKRKHGVRKGLRRQGMRLDKKDDSQ